MRLPGRRVATATRRSADAPARPSEATSLRRGSGTTGVSDAARHSATAHCPPRRPALGATSLLPTNSTIKINSWNQPSKWAHLGSQNGRFPELIFTDLRRESAGERRRRSRKRSAVERLRDQVVHDLGGASADAE